EPAHAPDGYSETKHSGKTASRAPASAASCRRPSGFSIVPSTYKITGVAWIAATRTVSKAVIAHSPSWIRVDHTARIADGGSEMTSPYHRGSRQLQDRFDTRRLADRLDERFVQRARIDD